MQGNAGNAGKCQGNVWEWVYSSREMQGTTRECKGWVLSASGMKGNAGGCQGNAGEYREMPGERMGVGVKCQVNAGNAGGCQGNVWEWM